jgi:hypothetical protein
MSHFVSACVVCQRPTVASCERYVQLGPYLVLRSIIIYLHAYSCQTVWYCSTECQRFHWPIHHAACTPVPTNIPGGAMSTPPVNVQQFQALVLFFHSSARHWRMIDVHIPMLPAPGGPRPAPQFGSELNLGDRPSSAICLNDVGGAPLNHPYQIFFRRSFLDDGSPINLGVRNLHPEITYPWAGNIVVLKFDGSRRQRYRHMEANDLPQIAQFFRTYPNE